MRSVFVGIVLATALTGSCLPPASARPLTPAEQRFAHWQGIVPSCDSASMTDVIASRFAERESAYWESGLAIQEIRDIRETGFRSNGADYIPRRFCAATAVLNDHKTREVFYNIGEDLGMAGTDALGSVAQSLTLGLLIGKTNVSSNINFGVDWCVVGLDRNGAYGLNCRSAKR